jgi:hypothetical protein
MMYDCGPGWARHVLQPALMIALVVLSVVVIVAVVNWLTSERGSSQSAWRVGGLARP